MNIKKEQRIILQRKLLLFSMLGISFLCGMISIRYEFRVGILVALLLLACSLVFILKIKNKLALIEKECRKLYPDIFYNVKSPSHYEISNYLKVNNFSFIEKNDMIYALKYYKTESILYTKHNVLSMIFLFENDNLEENKSLIEKKYSGEINEFVKQFNKDLNIGNKYVNSVFMRITIINKAIAEIIKDDVTYMSLVYNKDQNILYYPSYIKEFNFIPTNIPYVEIDKCIRKLFDLRI